MTPIQLVAMASTIANGGVYLPPHIVLESTQEMKGSANLKPAAFRPEDELPNPLPAGAHRVISEMTSAQMRKMMEGVVLYGHRAAPAQLNGYSAGGKTGTAQKIDPKTHTYSKTKYIASFVGFAPVNNPAVTIAVVMDSPYEGLVFRHSGERAGVSRSGAADSGVSGRAARSGSEAGEAGGEQQAGAARRPRRRSMRRTLESLFAEVNHLPADDPLRDSGRAGNPGFRAQWTESRAQSSEHRAQRARTQRHRARSSAKQRRGLRVRSRTRQKVVRWQYRTSAYRCRHLQGKSLRDVVVEASGLGLGLQVVGSGIAREQAPVAGTLVPAGTEVVVRFAQ